MSERFFRRLLRDDEELLLAVRRSFAAYLGPTVVAVLFSIAPFFLLVPLFRLHTLGVGIFGSFVLVALVLVVRLWLVASRTGYLLTSERIVDVDQRGIFERVVSDVRYDDIVDVSIRVKGVVATAARTGDVLIETHSRQSALRLRDVRNPERLHARIRELRMARPAPRVALPL